jgi:hypothetical protein
MRSFILFYFSLNFFSRERSEKFAQAIDFRKFSAANNFIALSHGCLSRALFTVAF